MQKICGIYKITNTVTGDFYIGSSKDVKRRWREHKRTSMWNKFPNNQLYQDMQKYGVDKFDFQVIAEAEESFLKEKEQEFIEKLQPAYNNRNANGWDIVRRKEACRKASRKYEKSDKRKKYKKEYYNQLCSFNGETLTLSALRLRFKSQGIDHPTIEAKKYLI